MDSDSDPDYAFYDWNKSHNVAYYKQTPGVFTSTKLELQAMLRSKESPSPSPSPAPTNQTPKSNTKSGSDFYWQNPGDILRGGGRMNINNNRVELPETLPEMTDTLPNMTEPVPDVTEPLPDVTETRPNVTEGSGREKRKRKKRKYQTNTKLGNLSKYSQREVEREISRNAKKFNEKNQIETLKSILGNPWDGVSFDEKKQFALHFYYTHVQVILNFLWIFKNIL